MRKMIVLLGLFLSSASFAIETNIWFQHGLQLHQSIEKDDQSVVFNNTFIGITISHYFVFGQNIIYTTRTNTGEASDYNKGDFNLLELGPRIMVFFNQNRNLSLSANYNPYCKGSRKKSSAGDQTVDGTSFNVNLSLQLGFWQNVFLGASLNYHSIMLTTEKVGGTESDITDNYSYIFPAFEFSVRF